VFRIGDWHDLGSAALVAHATCRDRTA